MALLDGGLRQIFGAVLGSVYLDATLTKGTTTDTGTGGFAVSGIPSPVKAMVSALSDRARAASGFPDPAVTIIVLRAGLAVDADLDDRLDVAGRSYRVIHVDGDPGGVAWHLVAVPAAPP